MNQAETVIGIDEAGRGPLAGPVYVGVVAVSNACNLNQFPQLDDSKRMSETDRADLYDHITKQNINGVKVVVRHTKASTIDRIGINRAIQRAINCGLRDLNLDTNNIRVLLDGGLRAPNTYRQTTVTKGDQKHQEISLASVLAKVARDRKMRRLAKKHPQYDFEKHKGYGTRKHRERINKLGPCKIHRKTYIN